MPVRLRLRRLGRKGVPYYHIVAADARAPRDGKFIEKVGSYDPTQNPAAITLDDEKALKWLKNGAQPTDTVRAIFRYKGINLRHALYKQGKDPETIAEIYGKWKAEKEAAIKGKKEDLEAAKAADRAQRLEAERKVKEARAAAIAARNAPPVEETPEEEAATEEVTEATAAENPVAADAAETKPEAEA